VEEIPEGGCKEIRYGEGAYAFSLLVHRSGGQVRAYVNRCPHFALPLNVRPGEFVMLDATLITATPPESLATRSCSYSLNSGREGHTIYKHLVDQFTRSLTVNLLSAGTLGASQTRRYSSEIVLGPRTRKRHTSEVHSPIASLLTVRSTIGCDSNSMPLDAPSTRSQRKPVLGFVLSRTTTTSSIRAETSRSLSISDNSILLLHPNSASAVTAPRNGDLSMDLPGDCFILRQLPRLERSAVPLFKN
jgi:hypothetical protein